MTPPSLSVDSAPSPSASIGWCRQVGPPQRLLHRNLPTYPLTSIAMPSSLIVRRLCFCWTSLRVNMSCVVKSRFASAAADYQTLYTAEEIP